MKIYIVEKEYTTEYHKPLKLKIGDQVVCLKDSDEVDWANWVYCKTNGNEGWVPKQIINQEKESVLEDYDASEFNLILGEILIAEKELNGWIWCYKSQETSVKAWAPLNHLKLYTWDKTEHCGDLEGK